MPDRTKLPPDRRRVAGKDLTTADQVRVYRQGCTNVTQDLAMPLLAETPVSPQLHLDGV